MDLDIKSLMLMQVILEAVLAALLLFWLIRSRRPSSGEAAVIPEKLKNSLERFLTESEKIADAFQANLKEKKELSTDLILKLDRRLAEYRSLLEVTEQAMGEAEQRMLKLGDEISEQVRNQAKTQGRGEVKANPAAPEVRAMVLQLAKKGLSVEDIAVKARLHRGEVELIIDLERQFDV
ncbi:MAG: hypothetical protein LBJ64_11865 [Deltaproteobacteria bacterium]|nr:hypothetical protein [Deltaproteobacteria bacterium]